MPVRGSVALLLHAHLPFVRHPEHERFLEENWLYEAIHETYLPLIRVLKSLAADGLQSGITLTMTPPLCEMLRDPLLQSRAERYLIERLAFGSAEMERQGAEGRKLARFFRERLDRSLREYQALRGDIVGALADLQESGQAEIITCAATHGFLPLLQDYPAGIRAQLGVAHDNYRHHFGRDPGGIWLPECGYFPGLEEYLAEFGLRWFVLDAHGIIYGEPRPRFAIFAPYFTPAGPAAFGRDRESSRQVWSAREGYPGDPWYRDFHTDRCHELSSEELGEAFFAGGARHETGFKYYRITGRDQRKAWYDPEAARQRADHHAGHFLQSREEQIRHLSDIMPQPPIVVTPFDAELFGHWWYEGPEFLDFFLRKAACDQQTFRLETPSSYLARQCTQQVLTPAASSWGHLGYNQVWLDPSNAWIYPHLHGMTEHMIQAANHHGKSPSAFTARVLSQMAREVLLAQSSDWAFLIKTGTAPEYATYRSKRHIRRFDQLEKMLTNAAPDEKLLSDYEKSDNLFSKINWRYYQTP